MPFNPTTDAALVLCLDDRSVVATAADGTGGTPADGTATARYWQDLSPTAAHATITGTSGTVPVYRASALGGKPGLDFGAGAALSCGVPAALNAAEGSNNYTVLIAAK